MFVCNIKWFLVNIFAQGGLTTADNTRPMRCEASAGRVHLGLFLKSKRVTYRCRMLALRATALLCLALAAAALAAERGEWLPFPGRRSLHSSCVFASDAAAPSPLPPCRHVSPPSSGYYGGWSVYTYLPAASALSHMSATFTVRCVAVGIVTGMR